MRSDDRCDSIFRVGYFAAAIALAGCGSNEESGKFIDFPAASLKKTEELEAGDEVTKKPKNMQSLMIDGRPYYYMQGKFFVPEGNKTTVVERPFLSPGMTPSVVYGERHASLPPGHRTIDYLDTRFFYADGVFYRQEGPEYLVIRDPFPLF